MQIGLFMATVSQTIFFYGLLWFLLPLNFNHKRFGLFITVGGVFTILAGAISFLLDPVFLMKYGFFVIAIPSFCFLYFLSNAKEIRFLFIVLTAMIIQQMLGVLLSFVKIYHGYGVLYFSLTLLLFGVVIYLAYRFGDIFHKIIFAYRSEFYYLSAIVGMLFYLIRIFTPFSMEGMADVQNLSISGLLFLLTICIYAYIGNSFQTLSKKYDLEMDNLFQRHQLGEATAQIKLLETGGEVASLYRHDLRHHFLLLKSYLEQGETEKISAHIGQALADIDSITPKSYCDNRLVNLILSAYEAKAEAAGISCVLKVDVPESLAISDTDLCSVLSNALENAIHATAKVETEKKIYIDLRVHKGRLLILLENPFVGTVTLKDGIPQTNEKGHGFGTRSIAHIASKLGGFFTCEVVGQMFVTRVLLPLGEE